MKYVVEMGLSAVKYIPNFTKTDSGIQNVMCGGIY
jgi:hypothetical protein